ncbi:hypothetical protein D3C78_1053760 [compost metagenome]
MARMNIPAVNEHRLARFNRKIIGIHLEQHLAFQHDEKLRFRMPVAFEDRLTPFTLLYPIGCKRKHIIAVKAILLQSMQSGLIHSKRRLLDLVGVISSEKTRYHQNSAIVEHDFVRYV